MDISFLKIFSAVTHHLCGVKERTGKHSIDYILIITVKEVFI